MGRAEVETLEQFASCWEGLEDPRRGNARLDHLHELPMIALRCVLCGGQGAVGMALFAQAKEPFLRSFPFSRPADNPHASGNEAVFRGSVQHLRAVFSRSGTGGFGRGRVSDRPR